MTLVEAVKSGLRKVVLSHYFNHQEVEYWECNWEEAVEILRLKYSNGRTIHVSHWQWADYEWGYAKWSYAGEMDAAIAELKSALWEEAERRQTSGCN